MKNSPDPEWFNKLEKRLSDYTEEPDADLWKKVAAGIGKPDPVWVPWAHRSAVLISALVFLWSGMDSIGPPVDLKEAPLTHNRALSKDENLTGQAHADNAEVQSQNSPFRVDTDKTTRRKNSKLLVQKKLARGEANAKDIPEENKKTPASNLFPSVLARMPADKSEIIRTDSLNSESLTIDSLQLERKKDIIIPDKKRRIFILYASLSTGLSFQKITPFINDGVVIESFHTKPVFSADRLGVSLQAGIQSKIAKRFEIFGGISLYRQSQTLTYQYVSDDDVNVVQEEDFAYRVTPGLTGESVKYSMLNLGAEAGMMYYLKGDRLAHKIGAGLSWQHGMRQMSEGETYNNAKSQYLFYQVFYRNEYAVNQSVNIFIQPFYKHALLSREEFDAPFRVKPYHAGLSFGILYTFRY